MCRVSAGRLQTVYYTRIRDYVHELDVCRVSGRPAWMSRWHVRQSTSVLRRRAIWHAGQTDGFWAFIGRYPDDKVSIIILSNLATVDPTFITRVESLVFANP